jgi:hypothetical protein
MLRQWMDEHNRKAWSWGEVDCCLALADWAVANGCQDGAAHLRGTYDGETVRQVIDDAGGVVALVDDCAVRAGMVRIPRPVIGAVGAIGSDKPDGRQWGAIFDGSRWNIRLENGFTPFAARCLTMWGFQQ